MPTQNVNLTPELDRFVKEQIASGYFNNASEVHRSALAMMAEEKKKRDLKMERLKQEIAIGVAQIEAGNTISVTSAEELRSFLDTSFSKAMDRLDAMNAERIA